MLYKIEKINRTVVLNDDLVNEYLKYDELREHLFSIVLRTKFGHEPTLEEISDTELSSLCNEIILSELKALKLLPQALGYIYKLTEDSKKGDLSEYSIGINNNG